MRNITIVLAVTAAVALVGASALARQHGSGRKSTETRTVPGFSRVRVSASLDLRISEGGEPSVSVTIDDNLQEYVTTTVKDDTLVIATKDSVNYSGQGLVTVRMAQLRELKLEGSGDAQVECSATPRDLKLESDGSGDIQLTGAAKALTVRLHGSGNAQISAPADEMSVQVHGSGDFTHTGTTKSVRLQLNGSGDAQLTGTTEQLEARTHGSGDVDARELKAKNAVVESNGSGDIRLTLTGGTLSAETSGSGDIEWSGAGRVEHAKSDGSGEIKHR